MPNSSSTTSTFRMSTSASSFDIFPTMQRP
jgi:hypothetical protein